MNPSTLLLLVAIAAAASLFFTLLAFSVRDFNRARLHEHLQSLHRAKYLDRLCDRRGDLVVAASVCRLGANMVIFLGLLLVFDNPARRGVMMQYFLAIISTLAITFLVSVSIPHAIARYASAGVVARFAFFLDLLGRLTSPAARIAHGVDNLVRSLAKPSQQEEARKIEQDIRSVVEEGQKEGVVDAKERQMIESVIDLRNLLTGRIMTARTQIVALDAKATLDQVKRILQESGCSRIPVYEGSLDHIIGILHAHDLLPHLGMSGGPFDLHSIVRPAIYVPETKPVPELLQDLRQQNIHIAIVLDEYGSITGLVTIDDILEELVGDLRDEYARARPALLKRIDDRNYEADARLPVQQINRELGLSLPEDAGYETLGGFLTTAMGRIPGNGATWEQNGVKFTVLDAQPQKINRVAIELALSLSPVLQGRGPG